MSQQIQQNIVVKAISLVKGSIQSRKVEKDGKIESVTDIIAEKITFLSNRIKEEKELKEEEN